MSVSADEFTESLHILTRNARAWTALCEALHIQPDTHPAELAKKFESLERWRSAGQTSLVALEGAFDSEADKGPQPGPNSPERLTFLADTAARTKNELITLRRKTTDPCGTCRKENAELRDALNATRTALYTDVKIVASMTAEKVFSPEHHRAFETALAETFGGFTRLPGTHHGAWIDGGT